MTEKELKKLSRKQLLELLLKQTERADMLQKDLEEANQKLKEKIIVKQNAGSIAEAALALNSVFEQAQKAAEQYLENIKFQSEKADKLVIELEEEKNAFKVEKDLFYQKESNKQVSCLEVPKIKKSQNNKKNTPKKKKKK